MFHVILMNQNPGLIEGKAVAVCSGAVNTFDEVKKCYTAKIDIPQAVSDVSLLIYREGNAEAVAKFNLDKTMPWLVGQHSGNSAAGWYACPDFEVEALIRGNGRALDDQGKPWHFLEIKIKLVEQVGLSEHLPSWSKAV